MIVDWVESALDRLADIFVAANPAERDDGCTRPTAPSLTAAGA